jgi:hypothetical protein
MPVVPLRVDQVQTLTRSGRRNGGSGVNGPTGTRVVVSDTIDPCLFLQNLYRVKHSIGILKNWIGYNPAFQRALVEKNSCM